MTDAPRYLPLLFGCHVGTRETSFPSAANSLASEDVTFDALGETEDTFFGAPRGILPLDSFR